VDGGPPAVLLVSLVNEDGEDIEKKLLSTVPEEREEEGSANEREVSPEPTTLTVCVTFLSMHGEVYGHNVSPG
jgi:hypothetical protein